MLICVTLLLYVFFSIFEAKPGSISCPDSPDSAKIMNEGRKVKRQHVLTCSYLPKYTMIVT